ncbi:MAG: SH3 domain-containing protein [Treponema sp.]|nr:SH3 domain-containing protein [Treponema sp.]
MKTKLKIIFGILLNLLCFSSLYAKSSEMYVATEVLIVKQKASIGAKQVGKLFYGDKVTFIKEKGNWAQIKSSKGNINGWVNSNSITRKKIVASNSQVSTNASELALAGKGFSSTIEEQYTQVYNISFDEVDSIEQNSVSENATMSFIEKGRLFLGDIK